MNLINAIQSCEERRLKYKKCRDAGLNSYQVKTFRDWSDNHIDQVIKALCGDKNE